ncbi:ABC transporter permease [Cellulomonas citrea]|uniref:ABC transporter permease n=1 Tax=Cellulomonas citrea TaxID=1909423 RepID=UPI001916C0A1|nr:ABC transporter permease [Cellulomonas citrea]
MSAVAVPLARPRVVRRLRSLPGAVQAAWVVIAVLAVMVLAGPWLAPHALAQDVLLGTVPAGSPGHPLGTDALGRDVLALTIAGTRSALVGPLVIALGSMSLGLLLGAPAGYRGGLLDSLVGRWCDLVLALPPILLAIVVAGVIGGGYWVSVAVLVVLFSPSDTRMIRSAVLATRHRPYLEATRVLGLSTPKVLVRHVLPNIAPIALTNVFLDVAFALVAMSSLSYLGVGVAPGAADWGRQLSDGRDLLFSNPAASVVPGVMIIVAAVAANVVGDWLADRFGVGEAVSA